jgi:hypothetical protein
MTSNMNTELIILGIGQLGYLKEVIAELENATTQKEIKKRKAQIYSALYAMKPNQMRNVKADDLTFLRKCYNAKTTDLTWEFWYEPAQRSN